MAEPASRKALGCIAPNACPLGTRPGAWHLVTARSEGAAAVGSAGSRKLYVRLFNCR